MFAGFTIKPARRLEANYFDIARAWTEADAEHRETTPAEFWFEQDLGVESYVMEDRYGVVFFFKLMRLRDQVELHIQFSPMAGDAPQEAERRTRIINGLTKGLQLVERALASRNVTAVFFTSKSPALIRFCTKRLGFQVMDPVRRRRGRLVPVKLEKRIGPQATQGNCG
jgi:hypothetical protein